MFTSPITRPLRWAIPLAVLGGIAALLWFVRPLEVTIADEESPRPIPPEVHA